MAKSSFIPRYQMIYDNLKTKIQSGACRPGSQLPFERELCEEYGVQRITVRKALDMLVQDGLIVKRPGLGSFVRAEERAEAPAVQSGTILFVMNKSRNDIRSNSSAYNAQLFFLMEKLCRERGYTLLYADISGEEELLDLTRIYSVSGAFLVSTVVGMLPAALEQLGIPTICLNHFSNRALSILPDNAAGMRLAMKLLSERGHRRVAFIGGAEDSVNAGERKQGFWAAAGEFMADRSEELIVGCDWTYEGSLTVFSKMLSALPEAEWPTAVVAASDMMAVGAMEAAARQGLNVPKDLSVIGFDNIDLCRICSPQLTSVGPAAGQMAEVAVQHMLEIIRRSPSPVDRYVIRIPVVLSERASVGPCRMK